MKNILSLFLGLLLFNNIIGQQHPVTPKGQLLPFPEIMRPENKNTKPGTDTKSQVFFEDFETGATSWSKSGSWQVGPPTSGPLAAYSLLNCVATNLSGTYVDNANDWMITPTISLPSVADNISMSFYEWFELESDFDYGLVKISTDNGVNWTQIDFRTGSSTWRKTTVDLTTYKGQNVLIAFNLTSDGSVVYSGWYVDYIEIQSQSAPSVLDASITNINSRNFPLVYMNVYTNASETLTKSNFKVYENGVLQTGLFDVTPPSVGGGSRVADIIFVVDVTGSMGDEIAAVKANMVSFLNAINTSGIDYRIGLVVFSDTYYIYNNYNFYGNYDEILALFNNITLGENGLGYGGDEAENQVGSMAEAANFNFRPGAQRIQIMLTDAPSHENNLVTPWTVSSLLNDRLLPNNIIVYPIFNTSDTRQIDQYKTIATATNTSGSYYHIYDNFNAILSEITSEVSGTYIVRYSSDDPVCTGTLRNVEVTITVGDQVVTETTSYIPCESFTIGITPETKELQNQPWVENTEFTIVAEVIDNYEPYVDQVTLNYKNTTATTYQSVVMTYNSSLNKWSGIIPSSAVLPPGIDFYITGTDGVFTVSDPLTEPSVNPYQIAILPNIAPVINHTPVLNLSVDLPVTINAEVIDVTNELTTVKLFYRKKGQIIYQFNVMNYISGNTYQDIIPADYCTSDGVEYYISAWDNFKVRTDFGTPSVPFFIEAPTLKLTTSAVSGITQTAATSGGIITSDGGSEITGRGVCWSITRNPTIANSKTSDGTGTGTFSSRITGLSTGTTYYVRAYATNASGTKYGSNITFTTLLLLPPVLNPATLVNQTSFTANWSNSSTATGYILDVATDISFESILPAFNGINVSNVNTYQVTGLAAYTTYFCRVKAYNSGGSSIYSEKIEVKTLSTPSSAPASLSASSCNDLVTINWSASTGTYFVRYRIYAGNGNNPLQKIDSVSNNISEVSKVISGLRRGSIYNFKISAVNVDGVESSLSNLATVTVKTGVVPKIRAKWDNILICSNLGDSIASFKWIKGISPISSATGQYYITNKQTGIYKVETIDKSGCKNTSNPISISGTKSLSAYPNPASESFSLKLDSVTESNVLIRVLDLSGMKMMEFETVSLGEVLLNDIPVKGLDDGVYIIQVIMNLDEILYTKVVVKK